MISGIALGGAEAGGALEVGDDEADHAVGDVARQCLAQGLEAFGSEARDRRFDLRAGFRRDVTREVEGAALEDADGEVAFDGDLGQAALPANLFDGEALFVERVGLVNRADFRRGRVGEGR
jgi:hypothetical protein